MKRLLITLLLVAGFTNAHAFGWKDLWKTKDQQGQQLLRSGKPQRAAETFNDPLWEGVSRYRAGHYEKSLKAFSKNDAALSLYNQGNALAQLGELDVAINAYEAALDQDPDLVDARFNKKLLEELLNQQQQNQSGDDKQDQSQNNQSQGGKQQRSDQQSDQSSNQNRQPQQDSSQNQDQKNKNKQQEQANVSKEQQETPKPQQADGSPSDKEQDQATEQWLRQIPDEPGGLLKQKFKRNYQRRHWKG